MIFDKNEVKLLSSLATTKASSTSPTAKKTKKAGAYSGIYLGPGFLLVTDGETTIFVREHESVPLQEALDSQQVGKINTNFKEIIKEASSAVSFKSDATVSIDNLMEKAVVSVDSAGETYCTTLDVNKLIPSEGIFGLPSNIDTAPAHTLTFENAKYASKSSSLVVLGCLAAITDVLSPLRITIVEATDSVMYFVWTVQQENRTIAVYCRVW